MTPSVFTLPSDSNWNWQAVFVGFVVGAVAILVGALGLTLL
jgi:hypothetical protein